MTAKALATALGVNPRTIGKFLDEGMPVARRGRGGRASLYDPAACQAWKVERERVAPDSGLTLVALERARKERAQAQLAEQMHAVRAGRLIDVDEADKRWATEIAAARSVILSTYSMAADRVFQAGVSGGVSGVERELKALAFEILRELSGAQAGASAAAS